MTSVFGIYFGNCTASIAVCRDDGRIDILANEAGDRVTLATVYICDKEEVVGLLPAGQLSSATVTRNKDPLGGKIDGRKEPVKLEQESNGETVYKLPDGAVTTPSRVATLIFKNLYKIGQSAVGGGRNGGEGRLRCVVTVPLWWGEEERSKLSSICASAGWSVLQVINEPSAALLAYQYSSQTEDMVAVVYRLGGYGCEATIIRVTEGLFCVVGNEKCDLGARAIVDIVCKHIADEFRRKTKLVPEDSRKCMLKLWNAAEHLVRSLSSLPTASVYLESLQEGVDFTASLSRARLDSLLQPLLQDLAAPLNKVLTANSLSPSQINKLVLCGGGLNLGRLRSYLCSLFPPETELLDSLAPQEVVACGAARQALLLSSLPHPPQLQPSIPLSILALPIQIKLSSGEELELKGPLPASCSFNITHDSGPLSITATQKDVFQASGELDGFCSSPASLQVSVTLPEKPVDVISVEATDTFSKQVYSTVIHLTPVCF